MSRLWVDAMARGVGKCGPLGLLAFAWPRAMFAVQLTTRQAFNSPAPPSDVLVESLVLLHWECRHSEAGIIKALSCLLHHISLFMPATM